MKKLLFTLSIISSSLLSFSQEVVLQILTPEDLAGYKPMAYVELNAVAWDNIPDLTVEANSITGELVFVSDGTVGDSLGCNPLTNNADVAGKIGVVWRGSCSFSSKAKNIFDAGGIGVLIVQNVVGAAPFAPGGTAGVSEAVDIPVVMTDRSTGEAIAPAINAGEATAYIGVVNAASNLRMNAASVLRAPGAAFPQAICLNASEFSVQMGAYVFNDGSINQTGVTVNAKVSLNDDVLYDETSTAASIAPGDSLFYSLATFSQPSYPIGKYVVTYTMTQDLEDDFPSNNGPVDASFDITENLFSYSSYNPDSNAINSASFSMPGGDFESPFSPCVVFRDANASRLKLLGFTIAATSAAGVSLVDVQLEISVSEWNNDFVDLNDPEYGIDNIEYDVLTSLYGYSEDLQNTTVFIEALDDANEQLILVDDQRYLFCVETVVDDIFLGYAPAGIDYTTTQAEFLQPLFPLISGDSFFYNGFGLDTPSAIGIVVESLLSTDDENRVDITPFPNPAVDFIGIPYAGSAGQANLTILDLTGKLIKEERLAFSANQIVKVNVQGVPNGAYIFNLRFDDNTTSNFKVVVSR